MSGDDVSRGNGTAPDIRTQALAAEDARAIRQLSRCESFRETLIWLDELTNTVPEADRAELRRVSDTLRRLIQRFEGCK